MTEQASSRPGGPAGSIIRASGKDGPQFVQSRGHRWTDEAEAIFLDALAATNNATFAAAQCGFSTEAIYKRARRDPGFARRMAEARTIAYGRLDEAIARAAEAFLTGDAADPDRADAMVWGLTELMLTPDRAPPRVRVL